MFNPRIHFSSNTIRALAQRGIVIGAYIPLPDPHGAIVGGEYAITHANGDVDMLTFAQVEELARGEAEAVKGLSITKHPSKPLFVVVEGPGSRSLAHMLAALLHMSLEIAGRDDRYSAAVVCCENRVGLEPGEGADDALLADILSRAVATAGELAAVLAAKVPATVAALTSGAGGGDAGRICDICDNAALVGINLHLPRLLGQPEDV